MTDSTKTSTLMVLNVNNPLLRIPFDWNTRSEARTRVATHPVIQGIDAGDVEKDNPGLPGLAESLRIDGQRIPVDVCLIPGTTKGEMQLATGFRRIAAVMLNASLDKPVGSLGLAPGEFRAVVHEGMSAEDIRVLNIGENIRENVAVPDQVFAFSELKRLNPTMTGDAIAARFGVTKGYVSHLLTIASKVDPGILKDWRESVGKPLPKNDMYDIATKVETAKEQLKRYKELLAAKEPKDPELSDGSGWVKGAEKRAHDFGVSLGKLIALGIVVIRPEYCQGWNLDKTAGELEAGENILDPEVAADVLRLKSTTTKVVLGDDGQKVKKSVKVSVTTHRKISGQVSAGVLVGVAGPADEEEEEEETEEVETADDKKQAKALAKLEAEKAASSKGKNGAAAAHAAKKGKKGASAEA